MISRLLGNNRTLHLTPKYQPRWNSTISKQKDSPQKSVGFSTPENLRLSWSSEEDRQLIAQLKLHVHEWLQKANISGELKEDHSSHELLKRFNSSSTLMSPRNRRSYYVGDLGSDFDCLLITDEMRRLDYKAGISHEEKIAVDELKKKVGQDGIYMQETKSILESYTVEDFAVMRTKRSDRISAIIQFMREYIMSHPWPITVKSVKPAADSNSSMPVAVSCALLQDAFSWAFSQQMLRLPKESRLRLYIDLSAFQSRRLSTNSWSFWPAQLWRSLQDSERQDWLDTEKGCRVLSFPDFRKYSDRKAKAWLESHPNVPIISADFLRSLRSRDTSKTLDEKMASLLDEWAIMRSLQLSRLVYNLDRKRRKSASKFHAPS